MCEAQPLPATVKSLEQLFHIDFTPPYDFDPIFATVRQQENSSAQCLSQYKDKARARHATTDFNALILDSAAYPTIVANKTQLENYFQSSISIDTPHSSTISNEKGILQLTPTVRIPDVLHCDNFNCNLLSVGQLADVGYTITFNRDHAKILKCSCSCTCSPALVADRRPSDRMYCLTPSSAIASFSSSTTSAPDSRMTWHERLAHLNANSLRLFLHLHKIPFIDITNFFCHHCALSKSKIHRIPKTHRFQSSTERERGQERRKKKGETK
jgi:hypothetical protein